MDLYSVVYASTKLKMFPAFDIINYLLMCMAVREDIQLPGTYQFAKKHPLSSWVSSMLMCFAGGIILNLFLAKPVVTLLQSPEHIMLATSIWYVINYLPGDIVYRLVSLSPVKLCLMSLKEVHRTYGIYAAVHIAAKAYPGAYLIMFAAGTLKGCGSKFVQMVSRLARGIWVPPDNELLVPGYVSKCSVVASLVFVLEDRGVIALDHHILFAIVLVALVWLRVNLTLLGMRDPFVPFENLVCSLLFGGMWDALQRIMSRPSSSAVDEQGPAGDANNSSAAAKKTN